MGAADDDVIGEAGVAVARVAHGPVDVGQGQVGQERGQAGALGDAAVAGAPLAPDAPRPGDEPDDLSCTGWGGLCFRVGFFVGILGVGWSFRGTKAAVGSGG